MSIIMSSIRWRIRSCCWDASSGEPALHRLGVLFAELLIDAGAYLNAISSDGLMALHIAAGGSSRRIFKALIDGPGCVDTPDLAGAV